MEFPMLTSWNYHGIGVFHVNIRWNHLFKFVLSNSFALTNQSKDRKMLMILSTRPASWPCVAKLKQKQPLIWFKWHRPAQLILKALGRLNLTWQQIKVALWLEKNLTSSYINWKKCSQRTNEENILFLWNKYKNVRCKCRSVLLIVFRPAERALHALMGHAI